MGGAGEVSGAETRTPSSVAESRDLGTPKGRRRAARVVVLFSTCLVVVLVLLRVVFPPDPDVIWHPTLTAKLDHIAETDTHYDVVFVGDSRAFRAIDPMIVEGRLESLGCPASVYNFGAVAMTKFEYDDVMAALEAAPAGAPEIVVTIDALTLNVGLRRDFDLRHRAQMDIGSFTESLDYLDGLPLEFGVGAIDRADLAAAYAVNQVPRGAIYQRMFPQEAELDESRLVAAQHGYQPWSEFYDEAGESGMQNLLATVEAEVANGGWERRWASETPSDSDLDRWVRTLEAHTAQTPEGALAVEMFIPSYYDEGTTSAVAAAWRDRHPNLPVVDLVESDLVGDYTDPTYFLDYWHLSEHGSEMVSRAAAEALCPMVESEVEG